MRDDSGVSDEPPEAKGEGEGVWKNLRYLMQSRAEEMARRMDACMRGGGNHA